MTLEYEGIKFYTTLEVAKKLEINVQTVREYIKRGKLKGQRVGKSFLISENCIKEFLKLDRQLEYTNR